MTPTILAVRGPSEVLPNHTAEFVAILGEGWTGPQREQISWRLELEGQVVGIREDVGPRLQIAVPAVAAGRRGRVVPYHALFGSGPAWEGAVTGLAGTAVAAPAAPVTVATRQDGRKWWARVGTDPGSDAEFVVGQEFRNGSRLGLFNTADPIGPFFRVAEWEGEFGFWPRLLEPTVAAEGEGHMAALNTWDTARFTFGFVQFAAHTPDANFVVLLRRLLALPAAASYFPGLRLADGRVTAGDRALEGATSTADLQAYFNPNPGAIDAATEVAHAARLIHWTRADPGARRAQVAVALEQMRAYLKRKAADLDGHLDVHCLLTWDVAHQGRARSYANEVRPALAATDPEKALLAIGATNYPGRIAALKREIGRLRDAGVLGRRRYDRGTGEFVVG